MPQALQSTASVPIPPHPCIWRHPHIPPHLGPQPQLVNGVFGLGVLGQQLVVVILRGHTSPCHGEGNCGVYRAATPAQLVWM